METAQKSTWKKRIEALFKGRAAKRQYGMKHPQKQNAPHEQKASQAKPLISLHSLGTPQWTPRNYESFAKEGYTQNPVCYRCIRMIAEAAASIPFVIRTDQEDLTTHPLLDLLNKPNSRQCGPELWEEWYGYLLVSGNSYMEVVTLEGQARELYALRPDRMQVIPGRDGWPEAYQYTVGHEKVEFHQPEPGAQSPILHQTLFHPTNDHYGMSPIEAAATAIDIHNAASNWNKALLDNSARPSGALIYKAKEGQLNDEQYERLRQELDETFAGPHNAGKPLLLEGGLEWKNMSLSPRDMDYIEAKYTAAREIALALGVPPMLLGIPGDNTYSNYAEANRSFWRQTIVPLAEKAAKSLTNWLKPSFGPDLKIKVKLDDIVALSQEQEHFWKRIAMAEFLTTDEKRALLGYPPLDAQTTGNKAAPSRPEGIR